MKRHSDLTHKVKFHAEYSFILLLLVGFVGLQIISPGTHPEYYEFNPALSPAFEGTANKKRVDRVNFSLTSEHLAGEHLRQMADKI